MGDTKTTLTWLLKDEVSGAAHKVNQGLGDLEKKAGSSGGMLGKLGGSLGALISPLALAAGGATLLTGFLVGSVKAAIDEQKGIEKLNAALKANVGTRNEDVASVEKTIAAREDLAFSDDDLRASFAVLVTSTKDVAEATDLQAIAMDLARFKGIDLATASEAVAKASQGSTKEIKALGLEVDDTATATQNLATIQKATAGQAEGYAKTMSGKWETFNNKLGDVVESIGGALLPIIEGAMDFLMGTVLPAFSSLAEVLGPILKGAIDILGAAFHVLDVVFIKPVIATVKALIGFVKDAIDWIKSLNLMQDRTAAESVNYHRTGQVPGHAAGGMTRPGWAWVGEQGPELVRFSGGQQVVPARQSATMANTTAKGVTIMGVSERDLLDMVERGMYFRLQTAGTAWRG